MSKTRVGFAMLAALLLVASSGCANRDQTVRSFHGVPLSPNVTCFDATCTSYNVQPYVRTRSKYGIGCMGNVPPGTMMNPEPPPESYSVNGIGKPGFPSLTAAESSVVKRIRHYVRSKTLRIAWLGGEFIVVDATDGPCEEWAGGYGVLNGGCNEFYQPGESPYHTHAGSGCSPIKRPWLSQAEQNR